MNKTALLAAGSIIAFCLAQSAMASSLQALPLAKDGSCPSGYSSSGNYCTPGSSARFAIAKTGSCPSGYSSSGNYCLAGTNAKQAIPKNGSCPSGYSSSGDYCLSSR
jgi:hypothetical protein